MLNRGPHQDSFVWTPAEEFVPKDASLLETETLALEVVPYAMVRLSVVSQTNVLANVSEMF